MNYEFCLTVKITFFLFLFMFMFLIHRFFFRILFCFRFLLCSFGNVAASRRQNRPDRWGRLRRLPHQSPKVLPFHLFCQNSMKFAGWELIGCHCLFTYLLCFTYIHTSCAITYLPLCFSIPYSPICFAISYSPFCFSILYLPVQNGQRCGSA